MSVRPYAGSVLACRATASLHSFFGPGGVLARTHPAYEFRRGQLRWRRPWSRRWSERRHLIVEAGTGTGKTLAYLLPVIRSGKRVIISHGNEDAAGAALLQGRSVPGQVMHGASPDGELRLRVCYMKGRSNYLCRKKLYDLTERADALTGLEEIDQFRTISDWEKTTETGDRAELAALPESGHLWPRLDARTRALHRQQMLSSSIAASSPRCGGGRRKATSSSSTITCSSPTWR